MFETASHFARYHLCQPLLKKFPQANPMLLNPIFSNRVHRVWVQLKYLLEQEQNTQVRDGMFLQLNSGRVGGRCL